MATYERDRHPTDWQAENNRSRRPFVYDRDFDSDFPIFNFSRSYERDRMRSGRGRDNSANDFHYHPEDYLPSSRSYKGLVGERSPRRGQRNPND